MKLNWLPSTDQLIACCWSILGQENSPQQCERRLEMPPEKHFELKKLCVTLQERGADRIWGSQANFVSLEFNDKHHWDQSQMKFMDQNKIQYRKLRATPENEKPLWGFFRPVMWSNDPLLEQIILIRGIFVLLVYEVLIHVRNLSFKILNNN